MKIVTVEINGVPYVPLRSLQEATLEVQRLRQALKDVRREVLANDPDGPFWMRDAPAFVEAG